MNCKGCSTEVTREAAATRIKESLAESQKGMEGDGEEGFLLLEQELKVLLAWLKGFCPECASQSAGEAVPASEGEARCSECNAEIPTDEDLATTMSLGLDELQAEIEKEVVANGPDGAFHYGFGYIESDGAGAVAMFEGLCLACAKQVGLKTLYV